MIPMIQTLLTAAFTIAKTEHNVGSGTANNIEMPGPTEGASAGLDLRQSGEDRDCAGHSGETAAICISEAPIFSATIASLKLSDSTISEYHYIWLRDNSRDAFDPSSGQRIRNLSQIDLDVRPSSHRLLRQEECNYAIEITWPDDTSSNFTADWLKARAYDTTSLRKRKEASRPRAWRNGIDQHPSVWFDDVITSDRSLYRWLKAIDEHGWCLVKGCPDGDSNVARLAERVGPTSHSGLYGRTWHVKSAASPVNLAYSSGRIPLHLDLSYYESPPGLQYLHCRTFEAEGGESVLLDAHAVSELLRRTHPEHFMTLTTIPATFMKRRTVGESLQRANAASMEYRRPHIELNEDGEIIRVTWSPPFMGPLRVEPADVPRYYAAAQAFEQLIQTDPEQLTIRFRLEPGTTLSLNQRRILHGREAYEGERHLEGTYTNIDDYKSTLQLLDARFGADDTSWRAMNGAF